MNHPLSLVKWPIEQAKAEIEAGWRAVDKVVWGVETDWPQGRFFRYPGLFNSAGINEFLATKHLGVFAADATGNDWVRGYDAAKVLARSLSEIEARQGGILLLHDTKDSTSTMTRDLLRQLKVRGYKIVHMVQTPAPPQLAPAPSREPAGGAGTVPLSAVPGAAPPIDQLKATFEAAARASEEAKQHLPNLPATPSVAPMTTQTVPIPPAGGIGGSETAGAPSSSDEDPGFISQLWMGLGSLVGLR